MKYIVNLQDNLGNSFIDKEFYSILNKIEFKKWLRADLKNKGYGKIVYLEIKGEVI